VQQIGETFREDFAWAVGIATEELADLQMQTNRAIPTGNVGNNAQVAAMNLIRSLAAQWTTGDDLCRDHVDNQSSDGGGDVVNA